MIRPVEFSKIEILKKKISFLSGRGHCNHAITFNFLKEQLRKISCYSRSWQITKRDYEHSKLCGSRDPIGVYTLKSRNIRWLWEGVKSCALHFSKHCSGGPIYCTRVGECHEF